ncbi:hypothetical protein G7054_g8359 [Neopestalotiopsis clavispora]|nr:hypothetical protein G7054_g8359 [Neopestalotiopsis clavispora]
MLSRDMLNARDVMIDTFVKYLSMPAERRGDAAYFTKTTESMLKDVGCNNQDIARVLVFHFWTILGNVHKVSFWILAYMAYDASLLERIRNEVSPAIKDGQLNEPYVAKSCPYLDSLISEVTRLTVASALGRDVIGPTPVGDKILQSGSKVLLPVHQLHLDNSVWGEDSSRMNPDRFVRDPKLYSSRSYRPFGGGHSLCPGRFFAKRIIAYAVAAMVTKFDIHIDIDRTRESVGAKRELGQTKATGIDSINFPRVDLSTPSPGASLPAVQGEDVFLILRTK